MCQMDDLSQFVRERLDGLGERYNAVRDKLFRAWELLGDAARAEDYQAVGLLSRDALIELGNAVFSPDFVRDGERIPGANDAKRRVEITLDHLGTRGASDEIRDLTKAVWACAVKLHHDRRAAREEAFSTILYATLAVLEVGSAVERATHSLEWVQNYGTYKCPVCGRTDLYEDEIVDYDPDSGPVLAARYLACNNCPWTSLYE